MSRISRFRHLMQLGLVGAVLCLAGCAGPEWRNPSLGWSDARTERIASEYHDPQPETDVGPDTGTRPRGFETARSEPRRVLEGAARVRDSNSNGYRPGSNYPAVVQP